MSNVDHSATAQIAAFNKELGRRLASLDSGERVDPVAARRRIQDKSQSRRKISPLPASHPAV